jgi:hypothetical protein
MFKKHSGRPSFKGMMFIPSSTKKSADSSKKLNGDEQAA